MTLRFLLRFGLAACLLSGCADRTAAPLAAQELDFPEASSGLVEQKGGTASKFMVAAANPIAVQAGYDAIKAGGNALDAAFATQLVLNLVEPQSSGIGGGAFVLYWDNTAKKLHAYDGRETAPATATEDRFLAEDGTAMRRPQAVIGGKSVGVPGLVSAMKLAHERHGTLPWADMFSSAIGVAENGFAVSPRLFRLLEVDKTLSQIETPAAHYYLPDGTPKPVGTVLKNPAMATTLQRIATEGSDAFYKGSLAEDIVAQVRDTTRNPADLTLADMAAYRAKERTPLCAPYRRFTVCGMPAPTSGGIGVIQTLGLLEKFDLPNMAPWSTDAAHLFVEASRLVYADRAVYIADPDFSPVPEQGLIDRGYLADRAALIDPAGRMAKAEAGKPPQKGNYNYGPGRDFERPSTTHISVIDDQGNAVSMTSSIEGAFGSHLMVGGFLLNNQLTDFSYDAVAEGRTVANRVEGGKRPRSSMAPIIVFDENDQIVAVSGSPGGMAIVPLVTKTLIAMLDWDMTPQDATNLPNILMFGPTVLLEGGTALADRKEDLEALGHRVRVGNFPSGVHAIGVRDGMIFGGADPRREGTVMGE
ncbi:MAG: gamma-glutamyltransferase [Rhodospirillaceae bacterium]|nr:gamma-glutamyltransferase [Rhodospirillaceae bacterium]MBT7450513.1 gamma-glutamyltransferase [Rhodospirillaceae bacterium]